ncbi:unnamed protein product [Polarella glacialis]|uniref:BD-FAE-like domain-containing protein n=1 Tax=Polarella glacialis TaxID=89957 RepID=A0A813HRM5_POLGL|nr:unnamed protein product [Polarella glacialis]
MLPSKHIPLWPGRDHPRMSIFLPRDGCPPLHHCAAMLVFQGGSYRINNGSGEGCAQWFADRGVLGIQVEYRTAEGPGLCAVTDEEPLFPRPVHDAVRAVRLVRQMALGLEVDPNRIGVVGFSAGGHLATMLCSAELPCAESDEDDLQHISFRPDVCVLCYPLISLGPSLRGPAGLGCCLRSLRCPEEGEESLCAELRVRPGHPPTFLWHTHDDELVPVAHTETYARALEEHGVPHKALFYSGPHALGMCLEGEHANDWAEKMLEWLGGWASPRFVAPAFFSKKKQI